MNGLIPQEFIDELLTRVDLVELIDAYIPLKKRGLNHLACCPFHQEKTPSFNVIAKKQFYHCFGCGASGNAVSFIMQYLHQPFPQAIETLATKVGMTVPKESVPEHVKKTLSLHGLMQKLAEYYQKNLRQSNSAAIAYLKNRGVNGEVAKHYQLGYALQGWHHIEETFPEHKAEWITTGMLIQKDNQQTYDRYRHRIMFPIHDRHGRISGFGGRSLDPDQQPKYLNSPETVLFQKSRELYGLYQILQKYQTVPTILVVEGYLDVIALAQFGIDYAVATLGTATSVYHIQLLSKYTTDIRFCFDGDEAGQQAGWRALESCLPHLDANIQVHFVFLPQEHDPDSLIRQEGKSAFEAYIQAAVPLHQLFFNTLFKDLDIGDLSSKNQMIHRAKPYFLKIPEGPFKTLLTEELARLTRIDSHRLEKLLKEDKDIPLPHSPVLLQRTPLRLALALMIQNPNFLTQTHPQYDLDIEKEPEGEFFTTVMQHLREHPHLNTATLIEHFRDSSWFELLTQLSTWDHQVPEAAQQAEFFDILKYLSKNQAMLIVKELIDKSKQQQLSAAERQTLQTLLRAKHPVIKEKT